MKTTLKTTFITLLFSLLGSAMAQAGSGEKTFPVDYVSTLVGTQSSYQLSTGNTYPAIFGFLKPGKWAMDGCIPMEPRR